MLKSIDLSLYLVTNRDNLSFDEFTRIILHSVLGGVTIVQLREKDASTEEMISMGKKLLAHLNPLNIPLIINDRIDVAYAIKADGVHLGQSDKTVAEARSILGREAIIGLSVESLNQAQAAEIEEIDYIAASPVFPSLTKTNCEASWGLEGLNQLCSFSRHPVVAIGGINLTNIDAIFNCGVAGAAVVSAIFNAYCPKSAAHQLTQKIHEANER